MSTNKPKIRSPSFDDPVRIQGVQYGYEIFQNNFSTHFLIFSQIILKKKKKNEEIPKQKSKTFLKSTISILNTLYIAVITIAIITISQLPGHPSNKSIPEFFLPAVLRVIIVK